MPTIFNFPLHLWQRKKATWALDNEAVTNTDKKDGGTHTYTIPPDHYNIVVKDEPEDTNIDESVLLANDIIRVIVHADVDEVVTDEKCTTSGDSRTIMHDHSYLCTTPQQNPECPDHSYTAESAITFKRKADAVQAQLVVARKKLRLKCQQTRRMKTKLLSLKALTKTLQKKLNEKDRVGLHKLLAVDAVQEQLVEARKKLKLKSQQTRRMKSRLLSLKALTTVLRKKLREKNTAGLQEPSAGTRAAPDQNVS